MGNPPSRLERQQRLKTRALPLVGVALVAFVCGAIKGCPGNPNRDAAEKYVQAWHDRDYEAMHGMLSSASKAGIDLDSFTERYQESEAEATMINLEAEDAKGDETNPEVPIKVQTRAFGVVDQPLKFSFGSDGIAWQNDLLFPGLEKDEELTRTTQLPARAAILANNGKPMAKGPVEAREYPLGDSMIDVTGVTGVPTAEEDSEAPDLESVKLGYTQTDPTGVSGLERAFNARLTGTPGGQLFAKPIDGGSEGEGRLLGEGKPSPAPPLKTTIDPAIQDAAVNSLGGLDGGVAALDARRGFIRALAGQAYSILQPPGSTMKIITATAALETGEAKLDSTYDYVTGAVADGRTINNAHGETCGGTFVESFAKSCNSVFAPLSEQVGEEVMTETSEKFGFNRPPQIWDPASLAVVDPPVPSIPEPGEYENDLGVSGIGQGRVQATPVLMASVSQAIANRGVSLPTPITREPGLQPDAQPVRVTNRKIASQVADMMVSVVTSGTGGNAAISQGQVAGKTGTAELGPGGEDGEMLEDAWFTGFAPADKPQLAVAVMIINASGDGGTVAAPIAGSVFAAGVR